MLGEHGLEVFIRGDKVEIQVRVIVNLVFSVRATQKRGHNPLIRQTNRYESVDNVLIFVWQFHLVHLSTIRP